MNYQRILEGILDIGEAMLCSGAENFRLDDTLYRMCKSYGFKRYDVFVIPSNIQITVETPEESSSPRSGTSSPQGSTMTGWIT